MNKESKYSGSIVNIAILSIILGLSVMMISVSIVTGFQNEISNKVVGFGSHIQISHFDSNNTTESTPISIHQDFYPNMHIPEVKHIQVFATKAGIVNTNNQIEGIVLKGIDENYDLSFFSDKLIHGTLPDYSTTKTSNDILISKYIANLLNININDKVNMFFIIGNHQRGRKLTVCGIYETGLESFDKKIAFSDIRHIQKLNNWDKDQVGGFEVILNDFNKLSSAGQKVYEAIPYNLNAQTIKQLHPEIFDWIALQDMNVIVILFLMIIVASVAIISTLLILILERTNMIGILKALGMQNMSIRKIFLYNASYIILKGMFWGNILALSLLYAQKYFKILKLNQESYYVSTVPVNIQFTDFFILNIATLIVCFSMMIIPSYIITKISPIKAIRMD